MSSNTKLGIVCALLAVGMGWAGYFIGRHEGRELGQAEGYEAGAADGSSAGAARAEELGTRLEACQDGRQLEAAAARESCRLELEDQARELLEGTRDLDAARALGRLDGLNEGLRLGREDWYACGAWERRPRR